MSEHHRGAWGTREDAVWWPGAIATQDQQTLQHHQHIINQHHQQQQLQVQQAQQIQHQVVQKQPQQQQHNDVSRSNASNVSTQQFTYKMGKFTDKFNWFFSSSHTHHFYSMLYCSPFLTFQKIEPNVVGRGSCDLSYLTYESF